MSVGISSGSVCFFKSNNDVLREEVRLIDSQRDFGLTFIFTSIES